MQCYRKELLRSFHLKGHSQSHSRITCLTSIESKLELHDKLCIFALFDFRGKKLQTESVIIKKHWDLIAFKSFNSHFSYRDIPSIVHEFHWCNFVRYVQTVPLTSFCHFLDADKVPSPAEDVMAAQQKPKPTHAIEEPLPPPPPSPQSTASQSMAPSSPPPQASEQMKSGSGKVLATPAVRKIAMEHHVSGMLCPATKLTIHSFSISDTKPTHWLAWSLYHFKTIILISSSCAVFLDNSGGCFWNRQRW